MIYNRWEETRRNKKNPEDKKMNFGITLDPKIMELLKKQAKSEKKSKSKLIEYVMKKYLNIDEEINSIIPILQERESKRLLELLNK